MIQTLFLVQKHKLDKKQLYDELMFVILKKNTNNFCTFEK